MVVKYFEPIILQSGRKLLLINNVFIIEVSFFNLYQAGCLWVQVMTQKKLKYRFKRTEFNKMPNSALKYYNPKKKKFSNIIEKHCKSLNK